MNFATASKNELSVVIAFVPLALLFLLILIVGLIVAKLFPKRLKKLPERVGVDRLVEGGGIKTALAKSKLDPSDIVEKNSFLHAGTARFAVPVRGFAPNPVSNLPTGIIAFLRKIIVVEAGGGLIQPMLARWESSLTKAEEEAPKIQHQATKAPSIAEQAKHAQPEALDVINHDVAGRRAR